MMTAWLFLEAVITLLAHVPEKGFEVTLPDPEPRHQAHPCHLRSPYLSLASCALLLPATAQEPRTRILNSAPPATSPAPTTAHNSRSPPWARKKANTTRRTSATRMVGKERV